jgi:hypothetical protein
LWVMRFARAGMTAGLCTQAFLGEYEGMDGRWRWMWKLRSGRGAHEVGWDRQ